MNILILSWRGPGHPHAGGAEKSTHEHVRGWVKAGHQVTLLTSYYPQAKREDVIDEVNIVRRGLQIFSVQWEAFKWYIFESHPKYDLVIDQFHGIPFFTPLYIREKKLAFIHEVTKEVWKLNPWPKPFNLIPAILGTVLEPLIFKLYKKVPFMTVSDSTKKDLVGWGIPEKNITIINNGLDRRSIKTPPPKEKKKILIYLGALAKDKGIEEALKIFAQINHKDEEFQFWVVGKGEENYTKFLKSKSKELGLERKIKFWGFVDEQKKYQLLSRAHLLINPSIREGWGLVVIEAASVGTPSIGYNVPGLRDSIVSGKTGILTATDTTICAQEILSLMNNEDRYMYFKNNCINWSKKFTWEKATQQSTELIENLIKNQT